MTEYDLEAHILMNIRHMNVSPAKSCTHDKYTQEVCWGLYKTLPDKLVLEPSPFQWFLLNSSTYAE